VLGPLNHTLRPSIPGMRFINSVDLSYTSSKMNQSSRFGAPGTRSSHTCPGFLPGVRPDVGGGGLEVSVLDWRAFLLGAGSLLGGFLIKD